MRETRWGNLAVSDAHVHFFSENFFRLLCAQAPGLNPSDAIVSLGWTAPPSDPRALAQHWVSELDRCGVDAAVCIASIPGDATSVTAAVTAFPERLRGYIMVNPSAPGALQELEALLAGAGVHGICLFPAMHRYSLHDDRAQAIIAAAAAHPGVVVFVHCGVLSVGVRRRLGLPSPFDLHFSNPVDLHSIALRFPQVRFVIPHFGAGYFREALMVCDLCPNVWLDTSSTNHWMAYEQLTLPAVFRRALAVAGPDRLVFGTDSSFFPRGWHAEIFEQQAAALRECGADEEVARKIFSGNFSRLFGAKQVA